MPVPEVVEFQRIAKSKDYTIKVVGDYAYRKFNNPLSPFVRLVSTHQDEDGVCELKVAIVNPKEGKSRRETWTTKISQEKG